MCASDLGPRITQLGLFDWSSNHLPTWDSLSSLRALQISLLPSSTASAQQFKGLIESEPAQRLHSFKFRQQQLFPHQVGSDLFFPALRELELSGDLDLLSNQQLVERFDLERLVSLSLQGNQVEPILPNGEFKSLTSLKLSGRNIRDRYVGETTQQVIAQLSNHSGLPRLSQLFLPRLRFTPNLLSQLLQSKFTKQLQTLELFIAFGREGPIRFDFGRIWSTRRCRAPSPRVGNGPTRQSETRGTVYESEVCLTWFGPDSMLPSLASPSEYSGRVARNERGGFVGVPLPLSLKCISPDF